MVLKPTIIILLLLVAGLFPGTVTALTVPGDTVYYPMGFDEVAWVTAIEESPDPAGFYAPSGYIVGLEVNLRSTARAGVNFTIASDVWNMSGNMTKGLIFSTVKLGVTDTEGSLTYYEKKYMSHSGLRLHWSATRGEMEAYQIGLLGNNTLFPNPTYVNLTTATQGYIIIQTVDVQGYEVLRDAIINEPQSWFERLKYGVGEVGVDIGDIIWAAILLIMPNEWEDPFTFGMGFILNAMKWVVFLVFNFWLFLMFAFAMGLLHAIIATKRKRGAARIMEMYRIMISDVISFMMLFVDIVTAIMNLFISIVRVLRG